MEKLCQLPHAMVQSHIFWFFICTKSCAVENRYTCQYLKRKKKHITLCLKHPRMWLFMFMIVIIKEFNPNCQLKELQKKLCNYLRNTITLLILMLKLSLGGSNRTLEGAVRTMKNSRFKINFHSAQGQGTAGLC